MAAGVPAAARPGAAAGLLAARRRERPRFFQTLGGRLAGAVDLLAVRYPGRQDRLLEPCVERMDVLADRVTDALCRTWTVRSRCSATAWARRSPTRWPRSWSPGTGSCRASCSSRGTARRTSPGSTSDPDISTTRSSLGRIAALGEVDPVVFRSPKLRELVVPALRADLRLIHGYLPRAPAKVSAPDRRVPRHRGPGLRPGVGLGLGGADHRRLRLAAFPGDHFYLVPAQAELLADLTAQLAGRPTVPRAAASVDRPPT